MRRFRYSIQTRQYVNQQTASRRTDGGQAARPTQQRPTFERNAPSFTASVLRPIDLAWNEVGVYPLLTALLGVLGVYFAVWLANGGAEELSLLFRR